MRPQQIIEVTSSFSWFQWSMTIIGGLVVAVGSYLLTRPRKK